VTEHQPTRGPRRLRRAVAVLLAGFFAWALSGCQAATVPTVPTPVPAATLFAQGRCGACHIIPGVPQATGQVGPSLCETAQAYREGQLTLQDIMDDIARPNARVHAGYLDDVMPDDYAEKFSAAELRTMAEYIAGLTCSAAPTPTE